MMRLIQKRSFVLIGATLFLTGTFVGRWMSWPTTPDINGSKRAPTWSTLGSHRSYDLNDNRTIPLTIVDEHHEVIPYWLRAVHMGKLKKSGNTLIHIDGHSDFVLPSQVEGTRYFDIEQALPGNVKYMLNLMEYNDAFIMSAVLAGLIDHLIWIKPTWLNEEEYQDVWMSIGITNVTQPPRYCACMQDMARRYGKMCYYQDRSLNGTNRELKSRQCAVFKKFRYSARSEHRIERLRVVTGDVFLDVDEDYFGVETDVSYLLDKGLTLEMIEIFDSALTILYCPGSTTEEASLNEQIRALLVRLLALKSKRMSIDDIAAFLKRDLYDESLIMPYCPDSTSQQLESASSTLANVLASMHPQMIKVVHDAKFCLQSSPIFEERPRFTICHGKVFPDNALTDFFRASKINIAERAARLEVFTRKLFNETSPPQIVTIARSIRDGYTPRSQFRDIERSLLRLLHRSAKSSGLNIDVNYDENLLFGSAGWQTG